MAQLHIATVARTGACGARMQTIEKRQEAVIARNGKHDPRPDQNVAVQGAGQRDHQHAINQRFAPVEATAAWRPPPPESKTRRSDRPTSVR